MTKYKLYNNEIELCFDPTTHTYTVDNEIIYGVTSICGILNKPAILFWAVNKAVDYIDKNLKVGVAVDEIGKVNLLKEAKYAHRRHKETAGDLGTIVHTWLEGYIKAVLNKLPLPELPINKEIRLGVETVLDWIKKHEITFISSERKVYSKKHKYAGTLDAEARINGHLAVIDFKTSSGIYPEHFLQTSAYVKALEEETGNKYDYTVIVLIPKNGGEFKYAKNENIDLYFRSFLGCLENYRRIRWEKTVQIEQKKMMIERNINGKDQRQSP